MFSSAGAKCRGNLWQVLCREGGLPVRLEGDSRERLRVHDTGYGGPGCAPPAPRLQRLCNPGANSPKKDGQRTINR